LSYRHFSLPAAPATLWNDAVRASEIATTAPWVIALRMTRMMTAGLRPDAQQQADNLRMVSEKVEAFAEAWWAIGWATYVHALGVMGATTTGRPPAAFPYVMGHALRPVHRRVRANLRRLTR